MSDGRIKESQLWLRRSRSLLSLSYAASLTLQLDTAARPLYHFTRSGAVAQFGRAPRSQCGGQEFDPPLLHQIDQSFTAGLLPSFLFALPIHCQVARRLPPFSLPIRCRAELKACPDYGRLASYWRSLRVWVRHRHHNIRPPKKI